MMMDVADVWLGPPAVVPILVGPLQALMALLPALLLALGALMLTVFSPAGAKMICKLLWRQKLVLGVLIVVIALAVWGYRTISDRQGGVVTAAETSEVDWPTFYGDVTRRGAVPSSPDATTGGVNWNFAPRNSNTFYSSPAVVGNRLYATSAQMGIFTVTGSGAIYCLDADTGAVVWRTAPDNYRATFSSPVIAGDYLLVGEGLHYTRDARIFCLNARTGELIWSHRTNCHVESTPAVSGNIVVVGAGDDGYYAMALEPQTPGQAQVLWHIPHAQAPDAEAPPLIVGDRVYLGLGIDGDGLLCVELATGEMLWRVDTPHPVFTPPSYADGSVFIGMGTGNFVQTAEEVREITLAAMRAQGAGEEALAEASARLGPAGAVWRIDAETGEVLWRFATERMVLGAVVVGEDRLYVTAKDGHVYMLDFQGREIARFNSHAPIAASAALGPQLLYVMNTAGTLYALDATTLTARWSDQIDASGPAISSPVLARGQVYVGSSGGGLYSFGSPQPPPPPIWAGPLGGSGHGGSIERASIPERAVLAWRYPEQAGAAALRIQAPAASTDGLLFVPVAEGEQAGLVALKAEQVPVGRAAEQIWHTPLEGGVHESPVADASAVFVVTGAGAGNFFGDAKLPCREGEAALAPKNCQTPGTPGAPQRMLIALSTADGTPKWQQTIHPIAQAHLAMTEQKLFLENEPGRLAALDHDGVVQWQATLGALQGPVAVAGDMVLATTQDHQDQTAALWALDGESGAVLWQVALVDGAQGGPVVTGNRVLTGTSRGVEARQLRDGSPLWQRDSGPLDGALILEDNAVVYINRDGQLVVLEQSTGRVVHHLQESAAITTPVVSRGAVLYVTDDWIMRVRLDDGQAEPWLRTGWLGGVVSPPILVDGFVYFATGRMGLVCIRGRDQ